jgi:hypothetical protein
MLSIYLKEEALRTGEVAWIDVNNSANQYKGPKYSRLYEKADGMLSAFLHLYWLS